MNFVLLLLILNGVFGDIPTSTPDNADSEIKYSQNGHTFYKYPEFKYNDSSTEPKAGGINFLEAMKHAHPHMAGLCSGAKYRKIYCGGSIVTPKTVLTAAHCIEFFYFDGLLDSSLRVVVGANRWKEEGMMYSVSGNVTHPGYSAGNKASDLGILITATNIDFNDFVKPIELDYDFQDGGVPVKVAGWGMTELGTYAKTLMEFTFETLTGDECLAKLPQASNETDVTVLPIDPLVELCTYHSPGHGNCVGDSGGPLVRLDSGKQVGIVSWGYPCAIGAPDMYVRISAFKDWLEEVIVK